MYENPGAPSADNEPVVEPTTDSKEVESSASSRRLFEVVEGHPMPVFKKKAGRSTYPFEGMKVGDHFWAGEESAALMRCLYTAVSARRRKHPEEVYNYEHRDGQVYVWRSA